MKKPGRNDPCPCGSGKKFKKCCESKMIGKKFMASKIDASSLSKGFKSLFQDKVSDRVSSLSQRKITAIKKSDGSEKSE